MLNLGPLLLASYMRVLLSRSLCSGQTCRFSVQHVVHMIRTNTKVNFETDTETFGRWPQSLRPALRQPWSQSQDQSLVHL